jgi:hypothetical protein
VDAIRRPLERVAPAPSVIRRAAVEVDDYRSPDAAEFRFRFAPRASQKSQSAEQSRHTTASCAPVISTPRRDQAARGGQRRFIQVQ